MGFSFPARLFQRRARHQIIGSSRGGGPSGKVAVIMAISVADWQPAAADAKNGRTIRVKLIGDWKTNVKTALSKKRPKEGWPKE